MGQSTGWGPSRYVTLVAVLAVHLAFLAVLMLATRFRIGASPAYVAVELLFLPPENAPKIRAQYFRPLRLSGDTAQSKAPPVLASVVFSSSPSGYESDLGGPGVDWKAEARRAVQAYEIRSRMPPNDNTLSVSPAEETWWPQARHRAGARYKTASGDWIVWINSSCYQIATSASNAFAPGAMLPQTLCVREPNPPQCELLDPVAAQDARATQ